jgi:hypothetical protein
MSTKELRLVNDGDFMIFMDSSSNEIYNIRKEELPEIRDKEYSEWIMQLLTKMWVTIEALYNLAVIIENEFPDNSINWYKTFYVVEKKNFLEFAGDILLPDEKSSARQLINKVELGQKETNAETHQIIDEIVKGKLEEYNLVRNN